jgi:DNA-binding MarR family transcriptional regulator
MGMHGDRGHGGFGGVDAAALASKLGVDQSKVTDALKAFRDANKPTTPPAEGTRPDPAAMQAELAKSLAASLGIDEAEVTAALDELRTAEQAERAAALKTRLDKAVTDGKLTQAEADAVTKAVQAGVIGGGGR